MFVLAIIKLIINCREYIIVEQTDVLPGLTYTQLLEVFRNQA